MSAFVVHKDLIDLIVTASLVIATPLGKIDHGPIPEEITSVADKMGQILTDANYASVNHLYNENTTPEVYSWIPVLEVVDDNESTGIWMQIHQACQCFAYQSCETPDWETSGAHQYIETIQQYAAETLRTHPKSRAYAGAPLEWNGIEKCSWGWTRSDGFPGSLDSNGEP